jgi:ABC-type cobalamin/Fe3+-siderophores transport system ATPase subunit
VSDVAVLSAEGITAGFDGPPVLDNVAVTAEQGETTVVLGPNGAGKSTLAKSMVGLLRIRTGQVYLARQGGHRTGAAQAGAARGGLPPAASERLR